MNKICTNCGNVLKDSAKFCCKCGSKAEEVVQDEIKESICKKCGYQLQADAKFCSKCGEPSENIGQVGTSDTGQTKKGKFNQYQEMSNEERKDKVGKYANTVKDKGKRFVKDVKNYKTLSKKKKRNIIFALGGLVALAVIVFMLFSPSVSKDVVSQAALEIAEQDYGYKLELTSYNIVDSFTAKSKTISGESVKAKMYLVIIEGEAKDANGEVVETVKYGISVVDPKKSGGYVTYSQSSQAEECTGMENKEIEEMLRSATAAYH